MLTVMVAAGLIWATRFEILNDTIDPHFLIIYLRRYWLPELTGRQRSHGYHSNKF